MTDQRYNQPDPGTTEWHRPLNENFDDLHHEVVQVVDAWEELPDVGAVDQSGNGQWPRFLVLEDDVVVRVTDEAREIVGGLGSGDHPLPDQHVTSLEIDGTRLYVQEGEPEDPDAGDVWIDTGD